MIIAGLILPVGKSKDFTLPREKWEGRGVIYLRRSGFYYVRNPHGVKLKFSVSESDRAFYDKAYADQSSISIGILVVVSTGSTPIISNSIKI